MMVMVMMVMVMVDDGETCKIQDAGVKQELLVDKYDDDDGDDYDYDHSFW